MSDNHFNIGTRFEMNSTPHVDELVVIDTRVISGYVGLRVAEKSVDGTWSAHWVKEQYIKDEENLGLIDQAGDLDESEVSRIVDKVGPDPEASTPQQAASLD